MQDDLLAAARSPGRVVLLTLIGLLGPGFAGLSPLAGQQMEEREPRESVVRGGGSDIPPPPPRDPGGPKKPRGKAHQFGVVLHAGKKEDFRFARNLKSRSFHRRNQRYTADGFVLHNIEAWPGNRFSGIWHRRQEPKDPRCPAASPPRRRESVDRSSVKRGTRKPSNFLLAATRREFLARHAYERRHGRRLVDVEVYRHRTGRSAELLAGVWQDCAPALALVFDLSAAELRALQSDRQVVDIEPQGGRFLALLGPQPSVDQAIRVGRTLEELESDLKMLAAKGWVPRELEIVEHGTEPRYIVVLERTGKPFWMAVGVGQEGERWQDCRIVSLGLESGELQAVDPPTCRALGKRPQVMCVDVEPPPPGEVERQAETGTPQPQDLQKPTKFPAWVETTDAGDGQGHDGAEFLQSVQLGCEHFHLVDISASRIPLAIPRQVECSSAGCEHNHPGHLVVDTGPAGPGGS